MKRTIAILTSISMLLCSVPAVPVTAADTPGGTYFLVADRNDNRAILFDLKKDENNPYGYNSYEISDWSTGEGRYTAASADWDVGDILLYTGGYSYTDLPSPNSNYFIMEEDGSFEEVGVLPKTLRDAVQKDENGCFLYKGDDDATAALVACLKIPEPTEATELPGYPDCLPELMSRTTEATELTDPTEPATITMEEDAPVFVHPRYVVLDKTESCLYLIRFPFEATDWQFSSNGTNLPTYVLYNEDVFAETFEQADTGDILMLWSGSLDVTEMSCWNYFILPSDPEDVGHFEWVGNLLGEEAYADNVTEWHSEKHLVFTSKEGSRYVVVANENDYPSFVPENELTEMPTDPTEESVTWTEPVTTARFRIWVVDAETGEPLAGVRIGNWVSDGSGAPYEGTYELYNGSYRFSVGEVPEGYLHPDLVNYGSGHYEVCGLENVELTFRIPREPEPTEPPTLPEPTYYQHEYVVLDKIGSVLYLLEYPCNLTTSAFEDNGAGLPTYILQANDPLFKDIIEQAEWGDIIEYTGKSLCTTELDCWNFLSRGNSPPDDETFVKTGSLLTDEDHVTEWNGETRLVFTSSNLVRYVVCKEAYDKPSFVREDGKPEHPERIINIKVRVFDEATNELLTGVTVRYPGGVFVTDGTPFIGSFQFTGPAVIEVTHVPKGYARPAKASYNIESLKNIDTSYYYPIVFHIPRAADATEPTEYPTENMTLPAPSTFTQDYVVLDKYGWELYLLEYPCDAASYSFEDNGANLPTYILKGDDPLFRSVIEEAEWGDIIEYTGTSLISTCLNCWNTLGRDGTPPDDETFVKKGSLLTDDDHVTEVDGERYLAFTSSDQARYLVIRKNGRPSFVPETDLTTSAEPTTRQFVVLDKASYPENTLWHPPIQAHTNLYVLEIPFEGADKDFNNNGYLLPVYTITDTKDTLFAPLCAEAEIGDVITYYGSTLSDYGKWEPMWESMYREPDVKGNYAAEDTFTVTGSFFTDEQYADYLTEWHGERHFVFTSTEGSRYVVFTAAYEYPSFFPERYLNDFGDLNHDGIHNASDAAMILIQAALAGAQDATFLDPRIVEAKINGDLDGDGFSNASDAALLLIYAAELGAGTTRHPLQAYLYERDHTVMRVPVWLKDEYWGYDKASDNMQLITSPEELKTYFTKRIPMDINSISYMTSRDEEVVRAEIMAAYPEDFFETHHLVALGAAEGCTDTLQEIRSIEQNADGTVTILLHHSEICGEPLSGYFTVLVAVDKSITDVSEITVKESRSRILYTS